MLATAGQPPLGDQWVVEPKFDGARCGVRIGAGRAELFSRQANNLSAFFPDVVSTCSALGHRDAILDGEIIVMDDHTRPSFQLLQRRLQTPRPGSTLQRRLPARLVVFDVLHLDGFDLTRQPYRERRDILQGLDLEASTPGLATSPAWFGVDGTDVLEAMVAAGMEGVVCKAIGSSYQAGRRSRQWIKTPYRHSGHVVVGGYVAAAGDTVGALLVGAYDVAGDFIYCGTVSTGFTQRARRELRSKLSRIGRSTSPFQAGLVADDSRVQWVDPHVVGRVEYREFTARLRHPAWKGVVDVDAAAVCLPAVSGAE
jgi:bifunctional non-homologous end joining protein LigD